VPEFTAVNAGIDPDPFDGNPILGIELVQL
jgi:hypothetical protein